MDSRNIVDELLNLINSAETKNEEKFSFGLFYKYSLRDEIHILTVEIRQEINGRAEEEKNIYDEKSEETSQIHEIHFNTIYELIKYIMWIKYKIEISDIFSFERKIVESINFNFYENEYLNEALKEIIVVIRNDDEMEEIVSELQEEAEEKEYEIDNIFEEINSQEVEEITLNKTMYSDNVYCNNCGYIWDNITDFKIIDFEINSVRENEIPFYSIDVKFQIESYLEDRNIMNYYDVKILRFLLFPSKIDDNSRRLLKNNLLLLYNMTEDVMYNMILKEFSNFKEYPVTISNITKEIKLEDFKEEAFSELAKNLTGLFYVGSKNIYMEDDLMDFCNEFMKRSFFEFKKHLFSEFVISSTGIRVNDLNTVNSFYTMIENIALKFEKEKENEENENY
jgi:hypothetical protein